MRDIPEYKPRESEPAVDEFMVASHTADIDMRTFMSEEGAIEYASKLALILPGHSFLVFRLTADVRGESVRVDIRRSN